MESLHLHTQWPTETTPVPNWFLDRYMLRANGEFVKIYLYLLRGSNTANPSLSTLADQMDCTERDILRAVKYWEKEGLLLLGYNSSQKLSDIAFITPAPARRHSSRPAAQEPAAAQAGKPEELPPDVPTQEREDAGGDEAGSPSPEDTLTAARVSELKENEDITQLIYIAEQYLGRTLSLTETKKILYFYDGLKFDTELIEFLIEYCVSKNHKSIHYIESVAFAWAESGISTVAEAKEEASLYSKTYFTIFKALGIRDRYPIPKERRIMDRWMQEWGFTMDLIQEACSRTVLQTGKGSLSYTNTILEKWHKANVRHLTDLEAVDADFQSRQAAKASKKNGQAGGGSPKPNQFNDYPHREYDFDQIKKSMFQ